MRRDPLKLGVPHVSDASLVPLDGSLHSIEPEGSKWHYRRVYDSWFDFVAAADGPCNLPDSDRSSRTPDRDFYGGASFQDALAMAVDGWDGLDARLAEIERRLRTSTVDAVRPRWTGRYDVRGSTVNVPRYLAGQPRSMRRRVRVQAPAKLRPVRIMIGASISSTVDQAALAARACYVTALVDALTRAGRPCEVWLYYGQNGRLRRKSGGGFHPAPVADRIVRFKRAEERLDRKRLAFVIGHVGCPRRLDFSVREREDRALRVPMGYGLNAGSGTYGSTRDPSQVGHLADVLIGNASSYQWTSPELAADAIRAQLAELGVAVRDAA